LKTAYHHVMESPVGSLLLSSNGDHLTGLSFKNNEIKNDQLAIFDKTMEQLKEYFHEGRTVFDLPLVNEGTDFQKKVWEQLLEIPFGTSISYKELALSLGDLKSIRAVGTANGRNNISIIYPCHRVIGSDGSLTGYAWGVDKKKWLLKHEGHSSFQEEQLALF